MSEDKAPLNIYQRLLAVVRDAGALAKTGRGGGPMSGKPFHEIDEAVGHLRPLLVEHGVFPEISVLECSSREVPTGKDKVAHYGEVQIVVSFVSVDNPEDRTAPLGSFGGGIDYSDKAIGKAISYALKSLLLANFWLRGQPDNEMGDATRTQAPPPPRQTRRRPPAKNPAPPKSKPKAPPIDQKKRIEAITQAAPEKRGGVLRKIVKADVDRISKGDAKRATAAQLKAIAAAGNGKRPGGLEAWTKASLKRLCEALGLAESKEIPGSSVKAICEFLEITSPDVLPAAKARAEQPKGPPQIADNWEKWPADRLYAILLMWNREGVGGIPDRPPDREEAQRIHSQAIRQLIDQKDVVVIPARGAGP